MEWHDASSQSAAAANRARATRVRILPSALVLLLLVACTSTSRQHRANVMTADALTARVDSVFADIRDDAPGCAVGAYRNGEMVLAKGYGLANTEDGRRITHDVRLGLCGQAVHCPGGDVARRASSLIAVR